MACFDNDVTQSPATDLRPKYGVDNFSGATPACKPAAHERADDLEFAATRRQLIIDQQRSHYPRQRSTTERSGVDPASLSDGLKTCHQYNGLTPLIATVSEFAFSFRIRLTKSKTIKCWASLPAVWMARLIFVAIHLYSITGCNQWITMTLRHRITCNTSWHTFGLTDRSQPFRYGFTIRRSQRDYRWRTRCIRRQYEMLHYIPTFSDQ